MDHPMRTETFLLYLLAVGLGTPLVGWGLILLLTGQPLPLLLGLGLWFLLFKGLRLQGEPQLPRKT